MVYWRLLSAASGLSDTGAALETMAANLAGQLGLPSEILNPTIGVDVLLHRYPKLVPHFEAVERCVQATEEVAAPSSSSEAPSSESIDDDGLAPGLRVLEAPPQCVRSQHELILVHGRPVQPVVPGRRHI